MSSEKISIKIEPMKKEDVDSIINIEEASYGEHHWSKSSFYSELTNNLARYYCAFYENELVGYIGSWFIMEEAHITNISVSPKFRGKHFGEALLVNVVEQCYKEEIKYITLEVRISNTVAINLYEKYGFNSLGERKHYYQDNNEDALIMWTENIFWDKFKLKYTKNLNLLKEQIEIL